MLQTASLTEEPRWVVRHEEGGKEDQRAARVSVQLSKTVGVKQHLQQFQKDQHRLFGSPNQFRHLLWKC